MRHRLVTALDVPPTPYWYGITYGGIYSASPVMSGDVELMWAIRVGGELSLFSPADEPFFEFKP